MVQVRILTAFSPAKLETVANNELKELYSQKATIFRVERMIYDAINEIYSLMIIYQEYVNVLEKGQDKRD
jgi:hypothetical protein